MEEDIPIPLPHQVNRKRKFEAQLLGIPLSKHVCWDQEPESDSSSDFSPKPKIVRSNIFAGDDESVVTIPSTGCLSIHGNAVSVASQQDYSKKTCLSCVIPHSYLEDSSSSSSTRTDTCSLDRREPNQTTFSKLEPLSISPDTGSAPGNPISTGKLSSPCPSIDNYEDQREYCTTDCNIIAGHQNEGIEPEDDAINSLYYSTMIAPDIQQGTRKLTIDKEFEEYFSMLML